MEPLNDFCRFCKQNMRSVGLYRYSNNIFDRLAGRPSIYQRLAQVGVTLVNRPASIRICRRCVNFLAKLEQVLPVYKRWIEEEKQDDASTSPTDKRDREPTPPETPRALKKLCHNPPSPGRANVRVNITETAPCEESCPGITFDVSEFTFDEENNCSNKAGGKVEEVIDNSDSDWEKEDSEQLESNVSDLLGCHELHERAPELPKRELCPECGAFVCSGKTHTCEYKIKPVSCNFCGKRCVDKIALKAHSEIHKESYEHSCKFCMAPFKSRLDKQAHEGAHTPKAKPYECPDCSMSFSKLSARNLHLKGHSCSGIPECKPCD